MVNENEEKIRRRYKKEGYKILRGGAPDFIIFKYDPETKEFSDIQFIEVKANSDVLSYEQQVYFMILQKLGVKCKVERIQGKTNQHNPTQLKATQSKATQSKANQFNSMQFKTIQIHPTQIGGKK